MQRRCGCDNAAFGMVARWRAPVDGAAALTGARRVARLHDEVALHLVEQHVVVVLDPAQAAAHGKGAYAAPVCTSLKTQQSKCDPPTGAASESRGPRSITTLRPETVRRGCRLQRGSGEGGPNRRLPTAWQCWVSAAGALAELEEVAGRDRAFVRVEIDDEVALAGLEQHRHVFLQAYLYRCKCSGVLSIVVASSAHVASDVESESRRRGALC